MNSTQDTNLIMLNSCKNIQALIPLNSKLYQIRRKNSTTTRGLLQQTKYLFTELNYLL